MSAMSSRVGASRRYFPNTNGGDIHVVNTPFLRFPLLSRSIPNTKTTRSGEWRWSRWGKTKLASSCWKRKSGHMYQHFKPSTSSKGGCRLCGLHTHSRKRRCSCGNNLFWNVNMPPRIEGRYYTERYRSTCAAKRNGRVQQKLAALLMTAHTRRRGQLSATRLRLEYRIQCREPTCPRR